MTERSEALLGEMTLEEKVALSTGVDLWHTGCVDRLGVAALKVSDGPSGVRGERFSGTRSTSFPCGTALGATWDTDLVRRVGEAMGDEARGKGVHVVLGPTVNIHRHPLAGRNFECYSEDPHLTARMAVAFVEGVQSRGVGCSVKHFVANDQEYERMTISAEVGERTLREIYLPPFEAAVREAGAWAVMSAYNRVGGTYCGENRGLLTGTLKEEWGFDGFVISDWWGTHSTAGAANGGLDLEMPGAALWFGEKLVDAVRSGEVAEDVVDGMARRMLRAAERTGALGGPSPAEEVCDEDPLKTSVARRAATESAVLLRNERDVLPLDSPSIRTIAVIGSLAVFPAVMGGGSSMVTPHRVRTPLDSLRTAVGDSIAVVYERGAAVPPSPLPVLTVDHLEGPMRAEYRSGSGFDGQAEIVEEGTRANFVWLPDWTDAIDLSAYTVRSSARVLPEEDGEWHFSLTSVGKSRLFVDGALVVDNWDARRRGKSFFGLGSEEVTGEIEMTSGEARDVVVEYSSEGKPMGGMAIGCFPPTRPDAVERAAEAAAAADAAVVIVGTGQEWETEGRDRPHMDLPWEQDALVDAVVAANRRSVVVVNASAPLTLPWVENAGAVVWQWFPGQEGGPALADILLGKESPSGRLPTTLPVRLEDTPAFAHYPGEGGVVRYEEGVFVGYRGHDAHGPDPLFCFGHGLSYTTFEYTNLAVDPPSPGQGDAVRVALDVTNSGGRAGAEVVQCYVHDVAASVARPPQELKAFARVHLEPGETRRVDLALDERAFAFWDDVAHGWTVEPGELEIRVGASSRDVRLTSTVTVGGAT